MGRSQSIRFTLQGLMINQLKLLHTPTGLVSAYATHDSNFSSASPQHLRGTVQSLVIHSSHESENRFFFRC